MGFSLGGEISAIVERLSKEARFDTLLSVLCVLALEVCQVLGVGGTPAGAAPGGKAEAGAAGAGDASVGAGDRGVQGRLADAGVGPGPPPAPQHETTKRSKRQTERGADYAKGVERQKAKERKNDHAAPLVLPGLADGEEEGEAPKQEGPSPQPLPADTPVSLMVDVCGTWFSAMASLYAAHLVNDEQRVTKQALRLLGQLEQLSSVFPAVKFDVFFSAAFNGEHATVKKRHGKGLSPEAALQQLDAALAKCKANGKRKLEKARATRRAITTSLRELVSQLPPGYKSAIRATVIQLLLVQLAKERQMFPKLASMSSWYRVADEDAHFIPPWSCLVHIIVSGDGDAFMAGLHCADDRQVVFQVVMPGNGKLVVRNARAVKAAIFRSLFPALAHYPEAWWSRSPAAVNFQEPAEANAWLLMMLMESMKGMSDFANSAFYYESDTAFRAASPADLAAVSKLAELSAAAAPLSAATVPLSAAAVPLSAAAVPLSAASVALSAAAAPLSAATVPLSAAAMPLSAAAAPLLAATVPLSAAAVPLSAAVKSKSKSKSEAVKSKGNANRQAKREASGGLEPAAEPSKTAKTDPEVDTAPVAAPAVKSNKSKHTGKRTAKGKRKGKREASAEREPGADDGDEDGEFAPVRAAKSRRKPKSSSVAPSAASDGRQHVVGVQGLSSLLSEWLKRLDSDRLPHLRECFAWLLRREKKGLLRYLAMSPLQLERFCEDRCRAALTVALQAATRWQGNG